MSARALLVDGVRYATQHPVRSLRWTVGSAVFFAGLALGAVIAGLGDAILPPDH